MRGPDGYPTNATGVLRSARGEALRVYFYFRARDGGFAVPAVGAINAGPIDIHKALAPGRYELEISKEGFQTETVPVAVEAGRTTSLVVRLER